MADSTRGAGFLHLNTPASITYTAGSALSVSDLKLKRRRSECVKLPPTQAAWRRAFKQYVTEEGYPSFAQDVEDEQNGEGVWAPPLLPKKAQQPPFFPVAPSSSAQASSSALPTTASSATKDSPNAGAGGGGGGPLTSGIEIVSHHKVSGATHFVYPDYDGVLSSGAVPQIVTTAEERAEKEALKKFYITPLAMTSDELDAFEELQALWKGRTRSSSFAGAAHRALAGNAVPGEPDFVGKRHTEHAGSAHNATAQDVHHLQEDTEETATDMDHDKTLEDALLMIEELINFA